SPAPNPKATLSQALGATYISSETTSIQRLVEQVGTIDLIFEAAGASPLAFELMPALGTNGIFVFTGVPGRQAPVAVDTDQIMRDLVLKNQVIFGTVNANRDAFEAAIRDLGVFRQRWPEVLRTLMTGRFPLDVYRDLLLGK